MPEPTEQTLQTGAVAVAAVPFVDADDGRTGKQGWGWGFWVAVGWIVFFTAVLLLVPVLPLDDPDSLGTDSEDYFAGMFQGGHLFGADEVGRDLFSRVLWGGRVSLSIGAVSVVLG